MVWTTYRSSLRQFVLGELDGGAGSQRLGRYFGFRNSAGSLTTQCAATPDLQCLFGRVEQQGLWCCFGVVVGLVSLGFQFMVDLNPQIPYAAAPQGQTTKRPSQ